MPEPLDIPEELLEEMAHYPDIPWTELVISTIKKELMLLKGMDNIERVIQQSKLTEADAIEIGRKINKDALKKYLDKRDK